MAKGKTNEHIPEKTITAYNKAVNKLPDVEMKGATMPYTSLNGHMFSFIGQDGIVALRLPVELREELINKHGATACIAHGTVMKEYVAIPDTLLHNSTVIARYFKQSHAYILSLKPKATKRK